MRLSLAQIVAINVDNVAANGLRRHQAQRQVLELGVRVQVLLVNGPLVDRIGHGQVDQFAKIVMLMVESVMITK